MHAGARSRGHCALYRVAEFGADLVIMLPKHGRRRIDARAVLREGEGRDRYAETAIDTWAADMAVNDAAGRRLRIGECFAHRAHPRRGHVTRLQELFPFVGRAREPGFRPPPD